MRTMLTLATLAVIATPATAKRDVKLSDPNRVICRTTDVIGSRLQTKKTCLTAMQWDQMEREQRATVDKIQSYKPRDGA